MVGSLTAAAADALGRWLADAGRYMREKGIDYFENSRRATLAQHAYAVENPDGWRAYGPDMTRAFRARCLDARESRGRVGLALWLLRASFDRR